MLSIIIPSYNSSAYMKKCIESCLVGGEAVEILIVNDGSVDRTAEIADTYAKAYPTIVKAIHQENKGHGGALNTGIRKATGKYLKVVDSDDWLDEASLKELLNQIQTQVLNDHEVDVFITNFVHEQGKTLIKKEMHYRGVIKPDTMLNWNDIGVFKKRQCLLMHSVIYKTDLLKESGVQLPEHTFYVDNLFVLVPLQFVETLYYLDRPLYRYSIGREDQSINEHVMMKRLDQQIKVNKLLIDEYKSAHPKSEKLKAYLAHHVEVVTIISSALFNRIGTVESKRAKQALWHYLHEHAEEVYINSKGSFYERVVNLEGRSGQMIFRIIYKTVRKVAGYG
nr:glycosyltransferase family 2 protein [Marinilactibacillus kalidii]